MSETSAQKADRYLVEGRVKVTSLTDDSADFSVQGTDTYHVLFRGDWTCDCPARVLNCVHIQACRKVCSFEKVQQLLHDEDETFKFFENLLQ